jgi:hypothetical protein
VTELFRNGAGAAAIQQLAGHAELATTPRYADLDANDLRSAIELIDGMARKRLWRWRHEAVASCSKAERFSCCTGKPRPASCSSS